MGRECARVSVLALVAGLGLACASSASAGERFDPGGQDAGLRLRAIGAFLAGVPWDGVRADPQLQALVDRVKVVQEGTDGTESEKTALLGEIGLLAQDFDPLHPAMPSPAIVHCYQEHISGQPLSCGGKEGAPSSAGLAVGQRQSAADRNIAMMAAAARYASALDVSAGDAGAAVPGSPIAGSILSARVGSPATVPGLFSLDHDSVPPPVLAAAPPPSGWRASLSNLAHDQFNGIGRRIADVDLQREKACAAGTIGCMLLPYVAASGRVAQYSWAPVMLAGDLIRDPAKTAYQATIGAVNDDAERLQRSSGKCAAAGGFNCLDYAGSLGIALMTWSPFGWELGVERTSIKMAAAAGERALGENSARALGTSAERAPLSGLAPELRAAEQRRIEAAAETVRKRRIVDAGAFVDRDWWADMRGGTSAQKLVRRIKNKKAIAALDRVLAAKRDPAAQAAYMAKLISDVLARHPEAAKGFVENGRIPNGYLVEYMDQYFTGELGMPIRKLDGGSGEVASWAKFKERCVGVPCHDLAQADRRGHTAYVHEFDLHYLYTTLGRENVDPLFDYIKAQPPKTGEPMWGAIFDQLDQTGIDLPPQSGRNPSFIMSMYQTVFF